MNISTRRDLFKSTLATGAALMIGTTACHATDPHPAWLAEWKALSAKIDEISDRCKGGYISDEQFEAECDPLFDARYDLVDRAAATPAHTVTGAAAMAQIYVGEFNDDLQSWGSDVLRNLLSSLQQMAGA